LVGLQIGANNSGAVSRPFVVSAVVLAFSGSLVGALWMMMLFGMQAAGIHATLPLHRMLQIDGFLTVLIMGIGYMIVPRFRNSALPSAKMAYISLGFALLAILFSFVSTVSGHDLYLLSDMFRMAGIAIFAVIVFWMIRIRPKLLGLADYFIGLSTMTLLVLSAIRLSEVAVQGSLVEVQMLLLFPILMIFGVEYKTMPSFQGFIRPRKRAAKISFLFAAVSVAFGITSVLHESSVLQIAFNVAILVCSTTFAYSLYIFGGFDNKEILQLISGEKKARYLYTISYSRLSFLFLYAGTAFAMLFNLTSAFSYISYDLAIHLTAIGFIGTTIALYLPLMLPPITGKQVQFAKFNHIPVLLITSALLLRAAADAALVYWITPHPLLSNLLSTTTSWTVVAALIAFVIMIHRSMKDTGKVTSAAAT
jgi:hypothetical protein